jgi:hypothetical protein
MFSRGFLHTLTYNVKNEGHTMCILNDKAFAKFSVQAHDPSPIPWIRGVLSPN